MEKPGIHHPFHLVEESPWPILASFIGIAITSGLLVWFHSKSYYIFFLSLCLMVLIIAQWWRDVDLEGRKLGFHTKIVELGLRYGIKLFIISEIFFFLRFFWAFFHSRLAPNIECGAVWPPIGVTPFDKFRVPLLNTGVLVRSGITVTWSHHAIQHSNFTETLQGLILTIRLGGYFTLLQGIEYLEASFRIADRVYGSTFFIATGFHGIHVVIGSTFLCICFFRVLRGNISPSHHFGFLAAIWYWHFVDVVWLFLFFSIYWWGGLRVI